MIDLPNLRKKEKPFMALTSLTINEFDELLATFSPLWEKQYMYYDLKGKARNKPAFREHAKIQLKGSEMKLFFILYYLKNNPLQESLALTFDVSQGKVNQWINSLLPILKESLRKINVLPARNESEWTIKLADRVEEAGEVLELWVDGSEREIPRPSDYKAQKEVYSGKKKHTIKNTLVTDKHQEVVFLGDTETGKVHDKRLLEEDDITFPEGTILHQDTGYQGHRPKGVLIEQPKKKVRGKELSEQDKAENSKKSSRRVRVEHSIAGVKRLRIVLDEIRLWGEEVRDQVMEIACGIHNLRVKRRITYQNLS